jgi:hypothetical protein
MPAVQLTLLREQIHRLEGYYSDPPAFLTELHTLFEQYSDLSYHPGRSGKPTPLIPTYHVPDLVLSQMVQELAKLSQPDPQPALALIDALWADTYYEPRWLAASLLGFVPLLKPDPVIERLQKWCTPNEQPQLVTALFAFGTVKLRRLFSTIWLAVIENWLTGWKMDEIQIGLKAIFPVIRDREFENLPPVFRMLSPLIQNPNTLFLVDIADVIQELAHRSPYETAFLLRNCLGQSHNPLTARLIRRCLPAFPVEIREDLRPVLFGTTGLSNE